MAIDVKIKIMRGVAGSGKSSWAQNWLKDERNLREHVFTRCCSADKFHEDDAGVYRYDPARAGWAHGECLRGYAELLHVYRSAAFSDSRVCRIVVDNTNTWAWELAPYVSLALAYNFDYEIVEMHTPLDWLLRHNTHDVPYVTIMAMQQAMLTESLPPHWKRTPVFISSAHPF